MKNWFAKLTTLFKVVFISFIAVVVAYLALIFCYFIEDPSTPNGLILGGGIGVISYLVLALVEKRDSEKKKPVLTIIVTILRYFVIASAIVIIQYKWGYKIFNLFSLVGGYLIPLIVNIIVTLVERKNV